MSANGEKNPSSGSDIEGPVDIIPDGNVILVVGLEKLRIRISSHLLCTSSPVFDAMLNSSFDEGTRLRESQGEPVDIKLPADSGRAMLHALKTLYGADPEMLRLSPRDIQELAFLADKYDMAPRFALAGAAWMSVGRTGAEHLWQMMTAAYWLRLHEGFHRMSWLLTAQMNFDEIFRYANETPAVTLGLQLGMATLLFYRAESEQTPRPVGGLCLHCIFKATDNTDNPLDMVPNCPFLKNHYIR
ncbi:hypothetical protein ACHAPJ_006204 [Fusarium lateritium]